MAEGQKKSGISVRELTEDEVNTPIVCSNGLSANGVVHVLGAQDGQREYTGRIHELPRNIQERILQDPQSYLRSLPREDRQIVRRDLEQFQREHGGRMNLEPRSLRSRD